MIETLSRIKSGDHVALLYRTRRDQLACAIPFMKLGLQANERCLYIADSNPVSLIRQALGNAGIDAAEAERRNALRILTKGETYLRHGLFEPARVLEDLDAWITESLELGFTGFRAIGEMTWALDLPSSFTTLFDYARQLETKAAGPFVAMCQFDETRFPAHVIEQMLEIHSIVIRENALVKERSRLGQAPNPGATATIG